MKEKKYQLTIDDMVVEVTKKKMKNLYLRINPKDGTILVSAPHGVSEKEIVRLVKSKEDWIRKNQERWEEQGKTVMESDLLTPEQEKFFRSFLKEEAWKLIEKWQPVIGVTVTRLTIRKMKTRWGSCNVRTGHVNLNLELAFRKEEQLEYVVIHEMCHLLEASHNQRFWNYVNQFCPEWKRIRQEMR